MQVKNLRPDQYTKVDRTEGKFHPAKKVLVHKEDLSGENLSDFL